MNLSPYNKIGTHLVSSRCKTTSSVAVLPILPNIALAEMGRLKMQDQKMEDQKRWKNGKCRTEKCENAGPNVRGWKCRTWKCWSRKPGPENGGPTWTWTNIFLLQNVCSAEGICVIVYTTLQNYFCNRLASARLSVIRIRIRAVDSARRALSTLCERGTQVTHEDAVPCV